MDFSHIYQMAQSFLGSAFGASATIAMVLEFSLRLFPSQKPLSLLHLAGAGAHKLGAAMAKIGGLLSSFGDLLDKVLPQNIAGE